jgi:integral membrane protein
MKPSLSHPVGRLRLCGMLEAISFLLLVGIGMPLKYFFGHPEAVRYFGMAHGVLFILFCLLILIAWLERKISAKHAGLAFLASLIPSGPFLIDRKLAADEVK